MKMITITWDDEIETSVKFHEGYLSSERLLQADLLKDVIGDLTAEYEEVLWLMGEDFEEKRKL